MKPTVEDIKGKLRSYEGYYSTLHTEQKEVDDYYELVFDADVPKRYTQRTPSTARDWVDVGVRHFTLDNPRSRVPLRNKSDKAREQVERLGILYDFWLHKDIMRIKDAAKKLLLRGEIFLKVNMDDKYMGRDYEDSERLFYFPLYLSVPDPINVYCSPAHEGIVPEDVIEKYKITVAEAEAICNRNGWRWETKKKPTETIDWISYYSRSWRCFLLGGTPVLTPEVQPNVLKMCPYVHVSSGAGQSNYDGKPEYLYRSLIWSKRDMLKMESRVLSQIDAINARYAWVKHKLRGDPEIAKKIYPQGLPTDPDELLIEIPDQLEVVTLEGESPPQGLYQQQAMLQGYSNPPQVLGGIRPTGVYSGQHQETLMATAKPIYKDAFKNMEAALGVTMGMGARILEEVYKSPLEIKNFAADSTRMYQRITPNDISGHYDCEVELLAEPPEATDMRKALGKGLRQGGSISHKTELMLYHDMSEHDAEDEIAQQAAETAMAEPLVREVVAKDAMARLGMQRELEAIEEAEEEMGRKTKAIPPIQAGEGMPEGLVKQRGRGMQGMNQVPMERE